SNGVFNPSTLVTQGPPDQLAVGDFDGDLVNDLAISQQVDNNGRPSDELTIAFGEASGLLSFTSGNLSVDEIEQMAVAHRASATGVDGIVDLVFVSSDLSTETNSLFLVYGNGSRALTTSLPLQREESEPSLPVALAVGRFDDKTPDVVVVGSDVAT